MSHKNKTQAQSPTATDPRETQSTNDNTTDVAEKALTDLKKQVTELTQIINEKDKHINGLKDELTQINNTYVEKINQKALEANKLVANKIQELNQKSQGEIAIARKYALMSQAKDLVDIISQFEAAVNIPSTDEKIINYLSGFKMFIHMFKTLLTDLNIHEISTTAGTEFNPEFMEVINFVDDSQFNDNQVVRIVTKGYKLHDRLIKPVAVIVNRKKS
ncbi:MAG: nucleotide exchange factor GrpE [Mycoplasmataceae bacterium]|jgi:molecular chaperone GrpE|nr:nucleotide exchange factor GrpE [Mycoplasmataceae bacterium]